MSDYLLDSNAAIAIMKRTPRSVGERLTAAADDGHAIGLSTIALFELRFGAARSVRPERNVAAIAKLLAGGMEVIPFDADDAARAGEIRAALEAKGQPIGPYDLLIAGQALARGLVLVSANVREFTRVEHLKLENWAAASGSGGQRSE